MGNEQNRIAAQIGAYAAFSGSICALAGTALWIASGTDIDASLVADDMAGYLAQAAAQSDLIVANLTFWIVMALLLGVAATAMTTLCERRPVIARVALFSYWTGVPLVIVSYVAWLAVVVQLAPVNSAVAVEMASVVGWFASSADWIATILIIGIGPTLIWLAGRGEWVPRWLGLWSLLTAAAAALTTAALLTGGAGLATYGFLIVPIGVGWMIAAGVVLLRRAGSTAVVATAELQTHPS